MTILFGPLDSDYHKRSVLYHATRLSMLHDRMLMRFDKVDEAADKVEAAAAVLVDITHGSAVEAFQDSVLRNSPAGFLRMETGQTLGL
ncbi:hypothetical protein EOA13_23505 [Mesorhizobium sp. M7A.F.Ca.US.011.01.1.1]|uniref:hypothetical protein n=1 Tax=Mesorhizobium sp. M7A.F.Ca.US.011.01.1.1 TaxID=2496741 RepID=UPI000FCA1F5C|nr:hypothetical protein [Mesorhizobium sp. M7A.F.Ca.US.011.01.1.1]RUX26470.1 hypothetical protein EOA13_23505 [Mesorhizobium sp. M7A.F.Ca.US.011.01.1.1]